MSLKQLKKLEIDTRNAAEIESTIADLAKQYDTAVTFIEEKKLEPWTHNKTIQKAVESYRITPEQKELLKTHRI